MLSADQAQGRELQRTVAASWLDSPTGEDGDDGPFALGVKAALRDWDGKSAFVMVELGCGTGRNSVALVQLAKSLIRARNTDALIRVYQVDSMASINEEHVLATARQNWMDDRCECIFVRQSFYDSFRLSKNEEDDTINFLFSQASLHWVDAPPIGLSRTCLASEQTRERAREALETVLKNFLARRAPSGAVVAALCLGVDDDDGDDGAAEQVSPVFTWMEKVYGEAFRAAFPDADDFESMMVVPQVSHRLSDIKKMISKLSSVSSLSSSWIWGGTVASPVMATMTPELAKVSAASMLSVFWPQHLEQIVWPHKSSEERQAAWLRATQAMEQSLVKHGFDSSPCQIAFVARLHDD